VPHPDVVVIGGGFAGLSAAVALADAGARVTVCEARPGLGGRATAFTDPATGERVDNGQHVLIGCYHQTFSFLRRIGTDGLVALDDRLSVEFVDTRGERSRLQSASLPAPWHLLGGLVRWSALSWSDRLAALRLGPALRRAARAVAAGRPLESRKNETLDRWLVRHGQTERLRELLWEPLAVAALNQSAAQVEAGPFVRVLAQMFGGTPRDSAIGVPRVPLDELYALPAAQYLSSRGSTVRTNAKARIVCSAERVTEVDVAGDKLVPGAVVCSVPWHALGDVIAPVPPALEPLLAAAGGMASSPIVTVNLWLDRAVTDVPFIGLPGRVMQWVFDKRHAFGTKASHLSLVSSGAADIVARANRDLIDLALAEVRDGLPAARDARVERATVVREKRATFSLAPGEPARPEPLTPINGLILAGDWTATGLPATIESAVVSGNRAASLAARTGQ
jgi:squalene-associated FAD-dependent desaturase